MEGLLIANAAATFFMLGVAWFVDIVHYPLFASVGEDGFRGYHRLHSERTTWVVLPPMTVELLTSLALPFDAPGGATGLAVAGAVLAVATWALTGLGAVPAHRALGAGISDARLRRLRRADLVRALTWTAHAVVVVALLAAAVG